MRRIILISAFCCQMVWCYGFPGANQVGAFAYQDSSGNRAFNTNLEHQQLALNAARKAFDLTSNQAGFIPNFHYRFPGFYDFPDFVGFPGPSASRMPQMNGNDYNAYASASAVPGMNHQVAAINPANPAMPNVDKINRYQDSRTPGGGYTSVSSSSYSTSSNDNGQVKNSRGAETIVNNNGRVTRYKVQS